VNVIAFFSDPLAYGFIRNGLVAAVLLGIVCAVMGTFVVLKGLAFIGDAVSHAAFPGVVIAFIAGFPVYLGGAVAAVGTALAIGFVSRRSSLRLDTSVGVLFAGAFALGVLLYSTITSYAGDLLGYLLGNILAIGPAELVQIVLLGLLVIAVVVAIRKELLFATFDPLGAAASGLPVTLLEYLLLGMLGVTIIVSIQAVGIVLVVAMLVTPAATAQLVAVRFERVMVLGAALAAAAAVAGLYASFYLNVSSGPAIVLIQTLFFAIALVAGPRTGLASRRAAAARVGPAGEGSVTR